jgi:hypothetical protein
MTTLTMEEIPEQFKIGTRVLMLINRSIGNTNKGSKRWVNKMITNSPEEWDAAYKSLLKAKEFLDNPDMRLYQSINSRRMTSAITAFKHRQIDLTYGNVINFYSRINDSFCSCLMQPDCRLDNYFLLDVDTEFTKEIDAAVKSLELVCKYKTRKGWHYIVQAFNPALLPPMVDVEIKKDALMLLAY